MTTGRINQVTIRSYLETKEKFDEQASVKLVFFKKHFLKLTQVLKILFSQSAQSERSFKCVSELKSK